MPNLCRIHKLKVNRDKPEQIAQTILDKLRQLNLYDSTLLYRGIHLYPQQLPKIRKYGTDRNPEDRKDKEDETIEKISARWGDKEPELDSELEARLRQYEDFEEFEPVKDTTRDARKDADPNFLWLFSEKKLLRAIEKYALENLEVGEIPIILTYRRDNIVHPFIENTPPEEIEIYGDDECEYRFKNSVRAIDEVVAAFRF